MSYAGIDDIFKRYAPIHTLVGSADNMVDSIHVGSIFVADAESLVDGYLSRRYDVPLAAPVAPMITQITSDLAIFNMLVEKLPTTPDFFQPRYDRALSLLEMIATGEVNVVSATVLTDGGDQLAWSSTEDYHPVFNPVLDPIDQAVDKDQVDQAKDDRLGDSGY